MYSHEYSFVQISNKFPEAGHRYTLTLEKNATAANIIPRTTNFRTQWKFGWNHPSRKCTVVLRSSEHPCGVLLAKSKRVVIAGTLPRVSTINFGHGCFKGSDILAFLVAVATKDMNHVRTVALFHLIFSKLKPTSTAVACSSIPTLEYKCCNVCSCMKPHLNSSLHHTSVLKKQINILTLRFDFFRTDQFSNKMP